MPLARAAQAPAARGALLFALTGMLWLSASAGAAGADGLLAWTAGLLYIAYDTWLLTFVAWCTRDLRALSAGPAAGPSIGVVVPARNEGAVLPACLDAVLAQLAPGDELLVVDDGSTDDTPAHLRERARTDPRLRVLNKPHSGKADSLNAAWPRLASTVIVTLDADTVLRPGALAALRRAFAADPALAAAGGVLLPRCRGRNVDALLFEFFQRFEYVRAFLSRAAWMRSEALLLVSGAFAAYRREVLERLGGLHPTSLVEDYELVHRLQRLSARQGCGWRVGVVGGAQAVTDAPASIAAFLRQRRRWFAGFLQTQLACRDMIGNPAYGPVGTLMLPVKTLDTLQPLFGLTAFILLLLFLVLRQPPAAAVLTVIALKLVVDFSYHLWSLHRYHLWTGLPLPARRWPQAALAAIAEPFSFQLLRHAGALLGWLDALRGERAGWLPQRHPGVVP